ncbi:MAG: molybdopterin-dependent oxidoreductase [Dehalococcoidales bacterium]|nr:molybdopterin-dependent oxidoreductase [Dehalococcoidales bacterium]
MESSKAGSSRRGKYGRFGINRRTFIKLSGLAGAAVAASRVFHYPAFGSVFSSPELPEGKGVISEKWVPTSCLNCATRCATRLRVVNGRAVKVAGNPLSRVSEGENCARAHVGLQVLYDPDRVTTPLKRTNPAKGRGIDPRWVSISWGQALGEVSERLKVLREKGQPHRLLLLYGLNTVSDEDIIHRFADAYGTPNVVSADGLDNEADKAGEWMADGNYTQSAYDLARTNYILSFGASILESYKPLARSLRMWGKIRRERPNRAKVVVIDPRYSVTALKADQWLPINPGADGALAMAIANVIIREGLYDANFIKNWTVGFDEYKDLVLHYYSPELVAVTTGIPADTIRQIAREFAQTKPAIAWRGRGATSWPNGSYSSYAIFCLNALVGSIDGPGGVTYQESPTYRAMPKLDEDDIAKEGKTKPRLDLRKTNQFPAAEVVTNQVADSILENKPYPVEVAIGFNSNFNMSAPGAWRWDEALEKVPYYVHVAPFVSEMAEYADIILPANTFMEEWAYDHSPPGSGFAEVRIKQPAVEPLYDTKGGIDIIFEVARRLGGTIEQSFTGIGDNAQGFVRYRTGTLMSWGEFIERGVWVGPDYQYYKYDRVFHTPSKKFEFRSGNLEALLKKTGLGIDRLTCLPHYEEVRFLGDSNSYPLVLSTYQPLLNKENGSQNYPWAQEMFLVAHGMGWTNFAEINRRTAQALGIKDGDMVYVESPFNKVKVKASVFEGIHPGVVSIASGQGHHAYGKWAKGIGVNPNEIIGVDYDRLSGQAAFFNTRVRVYKA